MTGWDSEGDAGRIVVRHLGGTAELVDPGGGPKAMHDLEITRLDGSVVAVEVTRHTTKPEMGRVRAVESLSWIFSNLQANWMVTMSGNYRVKKLHGVLPSLLATVEAAGIERIDMADEEPAGPAVEALGRLRRLGVRRLTRLGSAGAGGGYAFPQRAASVGAIGPDLAVEVVEHHAHLPDNRRKLEAAGASERHLFIWVESPHFPALAAIDMGPLPGTAPQVPGCVDAVWLATGWVDRSRVWRFSRSGGWEDLGTHRLKG